MAAKYYKVRDGVSISGDLHGGDVFDANSEAYKNHDMKFLLDRGDVVEASDEDRKAAEAKVIAPGLAKRIADANADSDAAAEELARTLNTAPTARGDHDVAIQRSRGDARQPAEAVAETPKK